MFRQRLQLDLFGSVDLIINTFEIHEWNDYEEKYQKKS